MQIREDAERVSRTIGGVQVTVPKPFQAGDPLTEGTAAMLNQTFFENVGNNCRSKLENEDGSKIEGDAAQQIVDAYVAAYEPGVRSGGGGGGSSAALSPLDREIRNLATEKLLDAIKAQGLKRKDVDFNGLRDSLIERHRDVLEKQASSILKAREKAVAGSEDILAGIDLGGAPEQEPAA
jgi:hypothetical protein